MIQYQGGNDLVESKRGMKGFPQENLENDSSGYESNEDQ